MTLEQYIEAFTTLRVNRQNDHASPHKVCMLLAVIDLIEKGHIESNKIFFNISSCIEYAQLHLIKSNVKSYDGLQCRDCGSVVLHTVPLEYSRCPNCGGTSSAKGSFNVPQPFRCALGDVATGLERVGKVLVSN